MSMSITKVNLIKKSIAALLVGGVGLTLFPGVSEAGKTITRSCDARYEVRYKKINGIPTSRTEYFGTFGATRHCGRSVPNRCRERARETIFTCGKVHYAQRWTRNTIPSHCTLVEGVKHYNVRDIKDELERAVCCGSDDRQHRNVDVELYVRSNGQVGCGSGSTSNGTAAFAESRRLEDSYLVDCAAARNRLCK